MSKTDKALRQLSRRLDAVQRRVGEVETTSAAALRSIEDGSIDVYDDDDVLRGSMGRQRDGSFGFKPKAGPAPAVPTEPDAVPVAGGAVVSWDGTFEEAQPDDVARVAVHVGDTPGFAIVTDDNEDDSEYTEVAAILSPRGGSAFIPLTAGDVAYIKLTAISESGSESDPSDEVEVLGVGAENGFKIDVFALPAHGAQDLTLTFEPIDGSVRVAWLGITQTEDVDWNVLGRTLTLNAGPMTPKTGHVVVVNYAYLPTEVAAEIGFQSTGWRYLQIARTDDTDYSDPDFDDSAWSQGGAAFGDIGEFAGIGDWPAPSTDWDILTRIWLRKTFEATAGEDLSVSCRLERYLKAYINGVLVADLDADISSGGSETSESNVSFTIPGVHVQTTNQLSLQVTDDTVASGQSYFDLEVSE